MTNWGGKGKYTFTLSAQVGSWTGAALERVVSHLLSRSADVRAAGTPVPRCGSLTCALCRLNGARGPPASFGYLAGIGKKARGSCSSAG